MNTDKRKAKILCLCAATAALYAALTITTAPFAYGPIQFRVAEALCVLPYFAPETAWGLFIGCLLSNIMSGNVFDMLFGSLATLLAALCTAYLGKKEKSAVLACLMPVVFNAFIIGAVITCAYEGRRISESFGLFAVNAGWVALGEAAVLLLVGLPLMKLIGKRKLFSDITGEMK